MLLTLFNPKTFFAMKDSLIQIKGLRDGLLISLGDAEWETLKQALLAQIDGMQAFFRGARVVLDVGNRSFQVNEMVRLRDALSERDVLLWAVLSESPVTVKTAQLLGLATRISKPAAPRRISSPRVEEEGLALWINRTLRSGTRVEFAGSVVILGDVNPGAEISAEGSVMVWGKLRGAVHAGASGDESAAIYAIELRPMQARIAAYTLSMGETVYPKRPSGVFVRDGRLVVFPWNQD
jgi:septum site-determining protein MinC